MNVSFIVTSYNIEPYIDICLNSIVDCTREGDEIIIVDDGSSDKTPDLIRRFIANGLPDGVAAIPVLLGTNTYGGVGIAANIGLDHARRDTVFFVDGDDWLAPEGFARCRDLFKARDVDFLLANYSVYDEQSHSHSAPADSHRWPEIKPGLSADARLTLALSFIAVPWRKFYRREFLRAHGLRFPEGDFFFEDNPFHWQVCRKAAGFSFANQVVCHHRINRPGQTMAASGTELLAFFTHYETILSDIDPTDRTLTSAAMTWLVNNMSWHLERLQPAARRIWASRAMACLQAFDADLWETEVAPPFQDWPVGEVCEQLRAGELQGFLTDQKIADLQKQLHELHRETQTIRQDQQTLRDLAQATANAQEYAALLALHKTR